MMDPNDDYDFDVEVGTFWSVVIVIASVGLLCLAVLGLIALVKSG